MATLWLHIVQAVEQTPRCCGSTRINAHLAFRLSPESFTTTVLTSWRAAQLRFWRQRPGRPRPEDSPQYLRIWSTGISNERHSSISGPYILL